MGCASSTGAQEAEVVLAKSSKSPKTAFDLPVKEVKHFEEDDVETQSVSTKASTFTSSTHSAALSVELMDLDSSWDFEKTPIAVPEGLVVRRPPTRRLHEKHVKKLNKFLSDVERRPQILGEIVGKRRLPFGGEPGEGDRGDNVVLSF
ncbi:unnamed protein product [Symbiodinium pilosum]|uniref:Uncharacterized protein n=1 Tax=Symbiodinium pilosum TaxID=2952 RepID=A0A812UH87_SYMPI|nr:unnamed protein product [Symbiodinium pilosum]